MSNSADKTSKNFLDLRSRLNTTRVPENLLHQSNLEDSIFSNMGKLEALCVARAALDANEIEIPRSALSNYSAIVEQYSKELSGLLNEYFN